MRQLLNNYKIIIEKAEIMSRVLPSKLIFRIFVLIGVRPTSFLINYQISNRLKQRFGISSY